MREESGAYIVFLTQYRTRKGFFSTKSQEFKWRTQEFSIAFWDSRMETVENTINSMQINIYMMHGGDFITSQSWKYM